MGLLDRLIRDTSKAARAVQDGYLRAMSAADRVRQASSLTRMARTLSVKGISMRHPGARGTLHLALLAVVYGKRVVSSILQRNPDWNPDPLNEDFEAIAVVAEILDELGIPYHVGGSMASSVHGEPQSTNGGDIVVDLRKLWWVPKLLERLQEKFFVQDTREQIQAMMQSGKPHQMFQIYWTRTGFKLDMHLADDTRFDESEFRRAVRVEIGGRQVRVKSAEDIIIRKLMWAKQDKACPEEYSQKQIRDAGRVVEQNEGLLDRAYLWEWARHQNVDDLLGELMGPEDVADQRA